MNTESLSELINNVGNNNDDEEDKTNDIRMDDDHRHQTVYFKADTCLPTYKLIFTTKCKIALVYELHLFSFQKVSKAFNCKFTHLRLRVMKTQD